MILPTWLNAGFSLANILI